MAVEQKEFDSGCAAFTVAMYRASQWKQNYFGAAYTTRLKQAVLDAEIAIAKAKELIARDDARP